jgi:hypothetical protein
MPAWTKLHTFCQRGAADGFSSDPEADAAFLEYDKDWRFGLPVNPDSKVAD